MAIDKVTSAGLTEDIITGQTAETTIADDDLILLSDTSASAALKKMTRSNFVSGIGGTNTPSFLAKSAGFQSIASATHTVIVFGTEVIDTDNAFASNAFTVPSGKGGKYFLYAQTGQQNWSANRGLIIIQKGGSTDIAAGEITTAEAHYPTVSASTIHDLSAGDVVNCTFYHNNGSSRDISTGDRTLFMGFKLI